MKIYTQNEKLIWEETNQLKSNQWVHCINASKENLKQIKDKMGLPSGFLKKINQKPMIKVNEEYLLLCVDYPYEDALQANSATALKYKTEKVTFIITSSYIVTFAKQPIDLQGFMQGVSKDLLANPTEYGLTILKKMTERYAELTQKMDDEINTAEAELASAYRNPALYRLLHLNESLMLMTISLKEIKSELSKVNVSQLSKENAQRFSAITLQYKQIYSIVEMNQMNINNVMDAYGNIIQNNVSHVVKTLTAITLILAIPTLIASIYGMNVPLPLQDEEGAFKVLIIVMAVTAILAAILFKKKKYM